MFFLILNKIFEIEGLTNLVDGYIVQKHQAVYWKSVRHDNQASILKMIGNRFISIGSVIV